MSVYENDKKPVVFDRAGMMDRLMDDEDLAQMLTGAFLKDIPLRFDVLREYLNTGDAKGAERLAHTIKGASASVGGDAFAAVASKMEKAARANDLIAVRERVAELESEFGRLKQAMEKELT
jgi:HPt (histidine-containing phosphotransfer) domain-containing protein